ncbi:MAG: hypothetical protein IT488_00730 [Gammaproteobacteria bacterium]|nr:hypothetical protein [Gammaproteobacteria bacterium]
MKKTRRVVSSIYMYIPSGPGLALTTALALMAGCAGSGSMQKQDSAAPSDRNAAANTEMPGCRAAIDDVTRYCTGDDASTGKCNDAKARTRQFCIN